MFAPWRKYACWRVWLSTNNHLLQSLVNATYLIDNTTRDSHTFLQECVSEFDIVTPLVGLWCIGLVFVGLYLVYRMRHVRKQFNEYFLIRRVAVFIVLAPILFVFVDAVTGPEYGALRRRMEVVLSLFITGIFFWTPIYEPVKAFIMKDEVSICVALHDWLRTAYVAWVRDERIVKNCSITLCVCITPMSPADFPVNQGLVDRLLVTNYCL